MRSVKRSPPAGTLSSTGRLLERGNITVRGRLPWASNATLLVDLDDGPRRFAKADPDFAQAAKGLAVYKPGRGERPLWDYPPDLYRREVAAAVVDEALRWSLVPPTVIRDGPFGLGSLQEFIAAADDEHYFTLLERPEHHHALKAVCIFDLLINNGDRKSGHCLLGLDGRIRAIDHGLSLHAEPKLRTVIWDFAGQAMPADLLADVEGVISRPEALVGLEPLIDETERAALLRRGAAIVSSGTFPPLRSSRSYPWPLV